MIFPGAKSVETVRQHWCRAIMGGVAIAASLSEGFGAAHNATVWVTALSVTSRSSLNVIQVSGCSAHGAPGVPRCKCCKLGGQIFALVG